MPKARIHALGVLVVLGLLVVACGNDDDSTAAVERPGEGVAVSMARGNWDTGFMQAAIYHALLTELGYEVNDPAEAELAPAVFFAALVEGEYDFWANSWFPNQQKFFDSLVDRLEEEATPIGWEMPGGVVQGMLVDIKTADAYDITTLDDIGDNPKIAALFDVNGNGKADLMGCNDGWGCQDVINDTIAHNGWEDTIEQVSAEYAALWADVRGRHSRGEPILAYVWTPGPYTGQLVPGTDVIWASVGNPIPAQAGETLLPPDQCPAQPCALGFIPNDIRVVARKEFLAQNPAAAKLFELVTIPVVDVVLQNLDYASGANSEADVRAAAAAWIQTNRTVVDDWLAQARLAA